LLFVEVLRVKEMLYNIIIIVLLLLLVLVSFFCIRFALIIINIQDVLEESLDIIDEKYQSLSKILEIPVFFNNPEIKRVINELEDTRDALLYIANQLTRNSNLEEEDDLERKNSEDKENQS
tara:strand:- start:325 stop:687 length:363 start_codon:yes stop_codon:yes gene_type:complete